MSTFFNLPALTCPSIQSVTDNLASCIIQLMASRVSALLTILACLFICCAPDSWERITHEEGGFSVSLPGKPVIQTSKVDGFGGGSQMTVLLYKNSRSAYFVGYLDLQDEILRDLDTIRFLKGGRDRTLAQRQGRLRWEREVKMESYPGIEFEAEVSYRGTDAILRARNCLVGRRYFQVFGLVAKQGASLAEVNRFLRSFKVR
jgi:hypothetical protein